ncbi:MAG: 3-phosphoglycerate dehydrogenase [Candidatus Coatesbacteria bacterium]|nr:3-phosphoglycerate dehydrogenase [Candidatus Coatesbacteria bacterium]
MARVLICDPVAKEAVEKMQKGGLTVDVKAGITPEELVKTVGDYDALVVRSATKVTKAVIEAGKKLKVIARGGVGLDNIDVEAAKAHGKTVINTPAAASVSVAELAMGHMLAISRFIPQAHGTMAAGKWEKKKFEGVELYRKTLGILGIGRIGKEVAKRALAFDMKVIAYDPYITQDMLGKLPVKMVSLDELLKESDYITLHMPHDDQTHYLLAEAQFAKMKNGVRIVNCARGGVIKEAALLDALKSGKVAFAGIDVFENEPVKGNEFTSLPNVSLTPHIGASTIDGQFRVGIEVADKLLELLR